jgi:hypothetical protein
MIPLSTSLALILALGHVYAADDCQRSQGDVIEGRPGQSPAGDVIFLYESRIERYKHATRRHIWCIESDKSNQNMVHFKWGDAKDPGKYFDALVEPGRGSPSVRTDNAKRISGLRQITFTKKNRGHWKTIDVDTLSSHKIGNASPLNTIVPIQFGGTFLSRWPQFQIEDGVIDFEALSQDRKAFLEFMKEERIVSFGTSLVISIPTRVEVAELLKKNAYDEYKESDFIRATASFFSTVDYGGGDPYIVYSVSVLPEKISPEPKLTTLLSDRLLSFRISPKTDQPLKVELPSGPIVLSKPDSFSIYKIGLTGPLVINPMKVEVDYGKEQPLGSFEASLVFPK